MVPLVALFRGQGVFQIRGNDQMVEGKGNPERMVGLWSDCERRNLAPDLERAPLIGCIPDLGRRKATCMWRLTAGQHGISTGSARDHQTTNGQLPAKKQPLGAGVFLDSGAKLTFSEEKKSASNDWMVVGQ